MNKHVLILGAAGRFGLAAARAFSVAGWQVVGQVRSSRDQRSLPTIAGVTWLPCELTDSQALRAGAAGSEVVVHALNPAYTNQDWIVEAPRMLQAAIDIATPLCATLMLPGNVYNFGENMPDDLVEGTPQHAKNVKGLVRIVLEQKMAASAEGGKLRCVVIRAGNFFGAGRGTMFDRVIVKDLPKGKLTVLGEANIATPWAYLPDLANTFVQLAQHRAGLAAFDVFHFAGQCMSADDWCGILGPIAEQRGWLSSATGVQRPLKVSRFPWWAIRLGAPVVPAWRSLLDMRYLDQRPHRLDNAKLLGCLGGEPRTSLPLAVAAALDELFPANRELVGRVGNTSPNERSARDEAVGAARPIGRSR